MVGLVKAYEIEPIFVFDGKVPDIKKKTGNSRSIAKASAINEAKKYTEDSEKWRKKIIASMKITSEITDKVKSFCEAEGIVYVQAEFESDHEMRRKSSRHHFIYLGIITEDSDLFAHGCDDVLFKFDKLGNYKSIVFEDVLKRGGFENYTRQKFCVLCGCDYFKIKGVGPASSLELMTDVSSIEELKPKMKPEVFDLYSEAVAYFGFVDK